MAMNMMTYLHEKNGNPKRIIDKISLLMDRLNLYKSQDYWLLFNEYGDRIGEYMLIEGPKIVTWFLSKTTNLSPVDKNTISYFKRTIGIKRFYDFKGES